MKRRVIAAANRLFAYLTMRHYGFGRQKAARAIRRNAICPVGLDSASGEFGISNNANLVKDELIIFAIEIFSSFNRYSNINFVSLLRTSRSATKLTLNVLYLPTYYHYHTRHI